MGRVRGGRHGFLTIATDKRLQSIEEFPHISWIIGALRERFSFETNAGYHQDPGRGWSPTAIFIPLFAPFFFFGETGEVVFYLLTPPCSSILLLSLPCSCFFPLIPSLKESLCVTPFLALLLYYAVHIVTQWRTQRQQRGV